MNLIQTLNKEQAEKLSAGKTIPDFEPGDTVIVNVKVVEGERTRIQAYEGVCIGRSGHGLNESFTVRKISYGEGVERVFPLLAPMIDSIKLVRRGKVRRAKLYYLRGLRGKSARIAEGTHHARPEHGRRRRGEVRIWSRATRSKRPACPAFFVVPRRFALDDGRPAPNASRIIHADDAAFDHAGRASPIVIRHVRRHASRFADSRQECRPQGRVRVDGKAVSTPVIRSRS